MDEYCIYDARTHCQKPELCKRIAKLEAALRDHLAGGSDDTARAALKDREPIGPVDAMWMDAVEDYIGYRGAAEECLRRVKEKRDE